MIIAKQRHGPTGTAHLKFDGALGGSEIRPSSRRRGEATEGMNGGRHRGRGETGTGAGSRGEGADRAKARGAWRIIRGNGRQSASMPLDVPGGKRPEPTSIEKWLMGAAKTWTLLHRIADTGEVPPLLIEVGVKVLSGFDPAFGPDEVCISKIFREMLAASCRANKPAIASGVAEPDAQIQSVKLGR